MARAHVIAALLVTAALASAQDVVQTIERAGIRRVVVAQGGLFDVSIKGTSGGPVRAELRSDDPRDRVGEAVSDGVLTLTGPGRERVRSIGSSAPTLSIRVPESTALSVETSTGNIVVETVAGAKELSTGTGNITVRSSRGSIDARSGTGLQRYDYVEGAIKARSSTGAVELAHVSGALDLESTTGRLWGREVRVSGDSRLSSSTGRIDLELSGPLAAFTFDLRSFTGRIVVGATEARGRLVTGSGPIRITGRTSTGRQTYRAAGSVPDRSRPDR